MKMKKDAQLLIRLPQQELERIKENAHAVDKTVSAYVRNIACNFCVLRYEHKDIIDHTHQITSLRNAINQMVYTILKTGEYVPQDLEFIVEKLKEISQSEDQLLGLMLDETERRERIFAREVRKIVRQRLQESRKDEE